MDAQFFFDRGVQKSKIKDLVGAIDDYTIAIELSYSVTRKTITTKQTDRITTHVDIIEINEGNSSMYYNRACAYLDTGNFQAAIDDYSAVIEYNSEDAESYFRRAVAYYCVGKDTEVEEDLLSAYKIDLKYTKELFLLQFRS